MKKRIDDRYDRREKKLVRQKIKERKPLDKKTDKIDKVIGKLKSLKKDNRNTDEYRKATIEQHARYTTDTLLTPINEMKFLKSHDANQRKKARKVLKKYKDREKPIDKALRRQTKKRDKIINEKDKNNQKYNELRFKNYTKYKKKKRQKKKVSKFYIKY